MNKTDYHVEEYGAIGDGKTCDSVSMLNCINDVVKNDNTTIKFNKTYLIDQDIILDLKYKKLV